MVGTTAQQTIQDHQRTLGHAHHVQTNHPTLTTLVVVPPTIVPGPASLVLITLETPPVCPVPTLLALGGMAEVAGPTLLEGPQTQPAQSSASLPVTAQQPTPALDALLASTQAETLSPARIVPTATRIAATQAQGPAPLTAPGRATPGPTSPVARVSLAPRGSTLWQAR